MKTDMITLLTVSADLKKRHRRKKYEAYQDGDFDKYKKHKDRQERLEEFNRYVDLKWKFE